MIELEVRAGVSVPSFVILDSLVPLLFLQRSSASLAISLRR